MRHYVIDISFVCDDLDTFYAELAFEAASPYVLCKGLVVSK